MRIYLSKLRCFFVFCFVLFCFFSFFLDEDFWLIFFYIPNLPDFNVGTTCTANFTESKARHISPELQ